MRVVVKTSFRSEDPWQWDLCLSPLDNVFPEHEADLRLRRVLHLDQVTTDTRGPRTRGGGLLPAIRLVVGGCAVQVTV